MQLHGVSHLPSTYHKKQVKEIGLKLEAITTSDIFINNNKKKKTEWKNRKQALSIHVPTESAM